MQCDGSSSEQSMLALDLTIRTHGWALTQVTAQMPWSYTIGLSESYDHPELLIAGVELSTQRSVVNRIVDAIVKTGGVDHPLLADAGITLVEVHPTHLADHWFGHWSAHYERIPAPGTFLQIVPPSEWFCDCHHHSMPHFEHPDPIRFGNRAERRRRRRRPR